MLTNAIKNWQDFLDSLATTGGNIVTLFWCSVLSGALWFWVVHIGLAPMVTPTFGVFTGFTGALLQSQKGNSSRQQMADRVETTIMGHRAANPVSNPAPSQATVPNSEQPKAQ